MVKVEKVVKLVKVVICCWIDCFFPRFLHMVLRLILNVLHDGFDGLPQFLAKSCLVDPNFSVFLMALFC